MKFLEENQSRDVETSKDLVLATQLTFRRSEALKEKFKDFLSSLVMNMQNMKDIWRITCSSSKCEILNYFDSCKYKYLQRSLLNAPSSDYMIQWAQYFLAKSQLTNHDEKKESQMLLGNYINRLKKSPTIFIDVLKKIDEILEAFEKSDEHVRFCSTFIHCLIDLCFEQSISFYIITVFLP